MQLHTVKKPTLHVCTVATEQRKTLEQLQQSCQQQNIPLQILGMGQPFLGFGTKFILVQNYLKTLPEEDVFLFVDAYDTLVLAEADTILNKFLKMRAKLVVSAEKVCWPDATLENQYPKCATSFKYLNSGVYIGYVGYLLKVFEEISPFTAKDNDQALFTKYYLEYPDKLLLDTQCELFLSACRLEYKDVALDKHKQQIRCLETGSQPVVMHGNGYSPWYQYIYDCFFSPIFAKDKVKIDSKDTKTVFLAMLVGDCEAVLPLYLRSLEDVMYSKKQIVLYVNMYGESNKVKEITENWLKIHSKSYKQVIVEYEVIQNSSSLAVPLIVRNKSFIEAQKAGCDYYFSVSCYNFITPFTLKELIERDRPIIAPLLRNIPEVYDIPGNYWYAMTDKEYYREHPNQEKIYNHWQLGTFLVPLVFGAYLIKKEFLDKLIGINMVNIDERLALSKKARDQGIDQYICNEKDFGVMINFFAPLSLEQEERLQQFLSVSKEWEISL